MHIVDVVKGGILYGWSSSSAEVRWDDGGHPIWSRQSGHQYQQGITEI